MIVNMEDLLEAVPIVGMVGRKMTEHGVSYGLSEAGYDIRIKQRVWLNTARRFELASAIEEFNMPRDLVGIVHDKSTWARQGLSVFNTVIEPGWKGFLTLELVYHGDGSLVIPAGAGIAQVVFHKTTRDAAYSGKYQGQADRPVEAIRS
ncbi:Dcd Deoxycytidine deaminase [uncultured Caudovirales phage]|uniref:Dcd Deoxycytidine deaminase n=1 Tax=uncultured Caudovirales phage TaxID=2100421 RepID=A0A6J5KLF9_9CAUD|nr:Dcd Deoxycytidine deaminase [uncultured Caudovirales phage]